jgi:hypothetical protein
LLHINGSAAMQMNTAIVTKMINTGIFNCGKEAGKRK